MNILLNFVPIYSGGGLQNAISFISEISSNPYENYNFIVVCRDGSEIKKLSDSFGFKVYTVESNFFGRIKFEFNIARKVIRNNKVSVVLTLFGNPPISTGNVFSISGFAYSNIIQSEVKFWNYLPWHKQILKSFIDAIRLYLAKKSSVIVLETDYLKNRAAEGVFRGHNLEVIKMTPSKLVVDGLRNINNKENSNDRLDLLCIAGPQPNKRIHLLAPILKLLSQYDSRYRLVTTIPDSAYLDIVKNEFKKYDATNLLINIGKISPFDLPKYLVTSKAIVNVSRLESFSNNWVEAWAAGVPLISTDADWARASCGDAAIYIDVCNPESSASQIHQCLSNYFIADEIINNGKKILKTLPNSQQKTNQYLMLINKYISKGQK